MISSRKVIHLGRGVTENLSLCYRLFHYQQADLLSGWHADHVPNALQAFQNSYRNRLEPQISDHLGAAYDGPTPGWNYPGSEADASDAEDASTDAGSEAEPSAADEERDAPNQDQV